MPRIPLMRWPEADELFTAWAHSLAVGMEISDRKFEDIFFGQMTGIEAFRKDYLLNTDDMCRRFELLGEKIFPDPIQIASKMSCAYTILPLMPVQLQAAYMEQMLRHSGSPVLTKNPRQVIEGLRLCPLCAKEDREQKHVLIRHVPHHLPGVRACYKHGVMLVDDINDREALENPVKAGEDEVRIARFMHDMYENPVFIEWADTKKTISDELERRGTDDRQFISDHFDLVRYHDDQKPEQLCKKARKTEGSQYGLARYLAVLFGDYASFRAKVTETFMEGPMREEFMQAAEAEGYEIISDFGPMVRMRCGVCGHEFHVHPKGFLIGVRCPRCDDGKQDDEIVERFLRHHGDGNYAFSRMEDGKYELTHLTCGTKILPYNIKNFIWNKESCLTCKVNGKVGQEKVNRLGQLTRVIRYEDTHHVDVLIVDTGYILKDIYYTVFWRGDAVEPYRSIREGEEKINKDGVLTKIVRYGGYGKVDVVTEDGRRFNSVRYDTFANGNVGLESINEKYAGTSKESDDGHRMEITEARGYNDIDVLIDGRVLLEHKTRLWFEKVKNVGQYLLSDEEKAELERQKNQKKDKKNDKKGGIKPIYVEYLGKEALSKEGLRMVLRAGRKSNDVDILVEGEVLLQHRSVKFFLGSPKLMRDAEYLRLTMVGKTNAAKDGRVMTVTAWRGCSDLDVRLDDGTELHGISHEDFKNGRTTEKKEFITPEKMVGRTAETSDGYKMEIVRYANHRDIDILVNDKYLLCHRLLVRFQERRPLGRDSELQRLMREGMEVVTRDGRSMVIVKYRSATDIDVLEDGKILHEHMHYDKLIKKGTLIERK